MKYVTGSSDFTRFNKKKKKEKTLIPEGEDVYLTPSVEFVNVLHAGTDRAPGSAGPGHGVGPRVVVGRHLPGPGLVTARTA